MNFVYCKFSIFLLNTEIGFKLVESSNFQIDCLVLWEIAQLISVNDSQQDSKLLLWKKNRLIVMKECSQPRL